VLIHLSDALVEFQVPHLTVRLCDRDHSVLSTRQDVDQVNSGPMTLIDNLQLASDYIDQVDVCIFAAYE